MKRPLLNPGFAPALAPLLALVLVGCGHVPVSTMIKLRHFDPVTFDPGQIRVAVQLHESFQPKPGETILEMTFAPHGKPAEKQQHRFALQAVPIAEEAGLPAFAKPGQRLHAYRLSDGDAQIVKLVQEDTRRRRERGAEGGRLTIQVSAKACRKGEIPAGPLLTTTYLRTEPAMGYLVLLKDVDMRAAVSGHGKSLDDELPACS